ncbi:C40 family peptidase [Arthrobacter sp. zg-ZUI100]|uniref:C40 family peptidase n=1 Tax=Arthrobacter jiangjiafuii TaxID=2817475 RepID=A0A975M607_9MICC|nr:NlpC/P60 family protein [Arthrobacter jiangjiafuii]MBP3037813.1 C40 family peptidase [Arthrobacter jiangjiafuii]MBP3045073.1 C40 family peptidase [Arthrobacter jiangjiafuii]QWC10606.1 C40 family peptidase [Arthrobacter jiangjiafuii]
MSSTIERARHRAPVERTAPLSALAQAVSANAGTMGRQAAVVVAASGLVLSSGVAANAAGTDVVRDVQTSTLDLSKAAPLTVPANVELNFDRPATAGVIAGYEAPEPEVELAPQGETVATQQTPDAPAAAQAAPAGMERTSAVQAAPAASSGTAAIIAAAALAQLGVGQDCTMLVTNALAAAGINFHDWPAGYLSLGSTVSASQAVPGDLIYYADGGMGLAHIAVYIGNGQAVHGGFNGGSTVVAPAELGSGGVYIRVG